MLRGCRVWETVRVAFRRLWFNLNVPQIKHQAPKKNGKKCMLQFKKHTLSHYTIREYMWMAFGMRCGKCIQHSIIMQQNQGTLVIMTLGKAHMRSYRTKPPPHSPNSIPPWNRFIYAVSELSFDCFICLCAKQKHQRFGWGNVVYL